LYSNASKYVPPIGAGPIVYRENKWYVFAGSYSGGVNTPILFRNDTSGFGDVSGLLSNWTFTAVGGFVPSATPTYLQLVTFPTYVRTGDIQAQIQFQNTTGNGPIFTNPTQTGLSLFQYMPIQPIVFTAVGTGRVYYFTQTENLPPGFVWDPNTHTITGKSVTLGETSFVVYAKDNVGISAIRINIQTTIPRIIRQQTSAGAYTYLLRQYTEVNAAQNSRDNRVFPTQETSLGKFMAPDGPDSTTPSNCKC
jgi:hypothetical protein